MYPLVSACGGSWRLPACPAAQRGVEGDAWVLVKLLLASQSSSGAHAPDRDPGKRLLPSPARRRSEVQAAWGTDLVYVPSGVSKGGAPQETQHLNP